MVGWDEVRESHILLVDDDPPTVQLFRKMLTRAGYSRITSTSDPDHACELFRMSRPDLVLLDLHMGARNGMDVLREIHNGIEAREYLPVIVISGDVSEEAKLNALNLGAKDFITKPIDMVETMLRIRVRLETRLLFLDLHRELGQLRMTVRALEG